MSALERIGEGLVSFGTGIPRVELEARRLANEQREVNLEATQNDLEAQRQEAERQAEIRRLMQVVVDGGEGSDDALRRVFAMEPKIANELREGLGLQESDRMEEAARFAVMLRNTPFEQRRPLILSRAAEIESSGDQLRNANDTLSLLDMDEQTQNSRLRVIEMLPLTAQQRLNVERGAGLSSEGRTFNSQVDELTRLEAIPEGERTPAEKTRMEALNIRLGRSPRAGTTSSLQREALDEELGDAVTDLVTERGEAVRFSELTGSARAKAIDNATAEILRLDTDIRTLNEGIAALDAGASTGAIESRFAPTIRESTVLLENVQARLGLNVIGATTFGSLSEEELRFALASAMPTGLQPDALREWLEKRRTGQEGLRTWYMEQIEFLNNGGTVAEFMQSKEDDDDDDEPGRIGRFEVTVED